MKKLTSILLHIFLFVSGLSAEARVLSNESIKTQFISRLEKGEHVEIAALGTSLTGGTWRWFDVMKEWLDHVYPGQISYRNNGVGASASAAKIPSGLSAFTKWPKVSVKSKEKRVIRINSKSQEIQ